jgi:hypothetical protein
MKSFAIFRYKSLFDENINYLNTNIMAPLKLTHVVGSISMYTKNMYVLANFNNCHKSKEGMRIAVYLKTKP